ncbi:MAG TPA: glycosyltransferase family 2 protein [Methanobacterium sp.]|nr:glycosyltransferase family 2 protein [Methanobacterium sp.]
MDLVSIVVPCFNEEKNISIFFEEVSNVIKDDMGLSNLSFEFIFVDDGSKDKTLELIKKLNREHEHIKFISFSRNFGKESAIYAGLENSSGDFVVLMDSDLQDPPSLLPEMYSFIKSSDYDCIATRRVTRKGESIIRSFFTRAFYRLINLISDTKIVDGARDYRLMTRQMVDSILKVSEYNRFSKGIFSWVGFKTKWLEYENIERKSGESNWSFWKLWIYAFEGIVSFSTFPLHISTIIGIILSILAVIFMIIIVIRTLLFGDTVIGWPSTMSVILFLGGIQLFSVGILGQYLSKTYLETKNRPIYICKETNI